MEPESLDGPSFHVLLNKWSPKMAEKRKTTNQNISDTDTHNLSERSIDKSVNTTERRRIAESQAPKRESSKPSEKNGNG